MQLIKFAKSNNKNKIRVEWYGGEPLLALDHIKYFNLLAKENKIELKQVMITNGYLITQDVLDFFELFDKYGFSSKVPEYLIEIHNDDNRDLNRYEAVATFMKEIEMTPPDQVVTLNLKFEGDDSNGTNS